MPDQLIQIKEEKSAARGGNRSQQGKKSKFKSKFKSKSKLRRKSAQLVGETDPSGERGQFWRDPEAAGKK